MLGNTVEVRAQLTNARLQPLVAPIGHAGSDSAERRQCSGSNWPPTVASGTFAGQFPLLQEGDYRLELPVPESADERLYGRLQVKMPELERENPQRNDALLSRIAAQTGGKYYIGMPAALGEPDRNRWPSRSKDRTTIERATVAPNPQWEETWLRWLMIGDLRPVVLGMVDPTIGEIGVAAMEHGAAHDELRLAPAIRAALGGLRRASADMFGSRGWPPPSPGWEWPSGSAWPSIGSSSRPGVRGAVVAAAAIGLAVVLVRWIGRGRSSA